MPVNSPVDHVRVGNGTADLRVEDHGCGDELDDPSPAVPGTAVDLERIRRAVREILLAVGENPDREGLRETPDRVARMYAEVFQGLHQDPRIHLRKLFTQKYD